MHRLVIARVPGLNTMPRTAPAFVAAEIRVRLSGGGP